MTAQSVSIYLIICVANVFFCLFVFLLHSIENVFMTDHHCHFLVLGWFPSTTQSSTI